MDTIIADITNAATIITDKLVDWTESFIALIPNMIIAILVLILFAILGRIVRRYSTKGLARVVDSKALVSLTATIFQMLVMIGGFLIALNLLNLEKTVTSILAGAGVIGLALGFAFQESASNLISGIFLAVRKPIKIGDLVSVDGSEEGVVERINLRSTVLRTFQGQLRIIPNKDVLQSQILNYSTGERRIDVSCGVSYGDDLEKVKQIAVEAIEGMGMHDENKPVQMFYSEFGDSSINFSIRFWIDFSKQPDYLEAASSAIMALKKAFDANDIMIPFPIRTLDFGIKGGEKLSTQKLSIVESKN